MWCGGEATVPHSLADPHFSCFLALFLYLCIPSPCLCVFVALSRYVPLFVNEWLDDPVKGPHGKEINFKV